MKKGYEGPMNSLPPGNDFNENFDPLEKLAELLGAPLRRFYIPEPEDKAPLSETSNADNADNDEVLKYRIPKTQEELVDEYHRHKLAATMMTRMIVPIGIAAVVSAISGNIIFLALTLAFCLRVLHMILQGR